VPRNGCKADGGRKLRHSMRSIHDTTARGQRFQESWMPAEGRRPSRGMVCNHRKNGNRE
jgi:hypothetical protein